MFKEHEILLTFIIGFLLILFLVLVFIFSIVKYKRRVAEDLKEKLLMKKNFEQVLLQSQVEVQELTFSALSKELHDNIGQLLSTAKMLLGITERNIAPPPDTLITANETIGKAINELRSLSKSLNKEWLEQFNLLDNLNNEVKRLNHADSVRLHILPAKEIMLKADQQTILFRIMQEAIQNSLKHALAKNIYIDITVEDDLVRVSIKDDGQGMENWERPGGVGILNMKHRTRLLGGKIKWLSGSNGCEVLITLPIQSDEG